MKKLFAFLLAILLTSSTVSAEIIYEEKRTKPLTDGVILESTDTYTENGWQKVDVVKIDLNNKNLDIKVLSPKGGISERQTVKQLAEEYKTKAAINGDFFNMITGETNMLGMVVSDGELVSTPSKDNFASFGLTDDNLPVFDYFTFKGTVYAENTSLIDFASCELYQINKVPVTTGGITMLTDAWGKDVDIPIGNYAMTAEFISDNLYKMTAFSWGGEPVLIPENGAVFTANYSINAFLNTYIALGDTIRVETEMSPDISKLKESIGGNTLLVKDGKVCNFTSNITGKNQRTAIGTAGDILYFVTVDGRKTDCPGFTQETLAEFMIELGCDTAINLDGGGSTTMVTEDLITGKQKVENDVSSLRRVSNAIGVISMLSPLSVAEGGQLELSKNTIVSGDSISVSYGFYDKNYNRIPVAAATILTSDKTATISGNTLTFNAPGEHSVYVTYQNIKLEATIRVLGDVFAIGIYPESANATEKDVAFTVTAYDKNGYSADIPKNLIDFSCSDTLEMKDNSVKKTPFSGTVTASFKGLTANSVVNGEKYLRNDNITSADVFSTSFNDAKTITVSGEIKTPKNLISVLQNKEYMSKLKDIDNLYCTSVPYDKWGYLKNFVTASTFSQKTVENSKIVTFSSKDSIRLSSPDNWKNIIDVSNNTTEKNIIFITDAPFYNINSGEMTVWNHYMDVLKEKGKNIFVISPGEKSEVRTENGIRYLYVGSVGNCSIESFDYDIEQASPLKLYFKGNEIGYEFK